MQKAVFQSDFFRSNYIILLLVISVKDIVDYEMAPVNENDTYVEVRLYTSG